MSAKPIKPISIPSRAEVAERLARIRESEIDYSDLPEIGEEFFKAARLLMPEKTTPVTMRVDRKVLRFFKAQGPGYQTRINAVLRAYIETVANRRTGSRTRRRAAGGR